MKCIILKLILLTALQSAVIFTGVANAQASWANPVLCEQIGEACGFSRAHEYSHGFRDDIILRPDEYPQSLEDRGDCWAAKYVDSHEVEAVINLLSDSEAIKDLPIFGDPAHRIEVIKKCAADGGIWLGRKK